MTENVASLARELPDAELVLAFVSPLGTPLDGVQQALVDALSEHEYDVELLVRISALIDATQANPEEECAEVRQERLMRDGNDLRREHGSGILALMAMAAISASRAQGDDGQAIAGRRRAYLIRSLKHPEEVVQLRQVYGNGFFLLGVSAPRTLRRDTLMNEENDFRPSAADRLLDKDAGEEEDIGQQTRQTFALADAFLWIDGDDADQVEQKVGRILDLLFSCPFHPPTKDEHAMFMAYAAALRSSDLSRQVGAVVTNRFGDVVASGANEAPAPLGGTYWPSRIEFTDETNELEGPDYLRGYDANERERNKILARVIAKLVPQALKPDDMSSEQRAALIKSYKKLLKGTGILDLTEFGRAVHAEMAALMACTKSGVTPVGGTLYCTTFPCHNCAKHIVASGITKVVYVEPYAKSKAKDLHADAISLPYEDDEIPAGPRVEFSPFEGIGPRRFVDLFSLSLGSGRPVSRKRKGADGARFEWTRGRGSIPRLPLDPLSYLDREHRAVKHSYPLLGGTPPPQEESNDDHDQAEQLTAEDPDL